MNQRAERSGKACFRFHPAVRCNAEQLASVYGKGERERQVHRILAVLNHRSAGRCFFVTAVCRGKTVGLLQLCQERIRPHRFRIRGLHTRKEFRNQGLATHLLQLGIKCIVESHHGKEVISYILPTNTASITAHEHAGFIPCTSRLLQPEHYRCFVFSRNDPEQHERSPAATAGFG